MKRAGRHFAGLAGAAALALLGACDRPVDSGPPTVSVPADPWMPEGAGAIEGSALFAPCASCHLSDASGRTDGTVPRLAGQREAVLVRKLERLQAGEVHLPVMVPFARALSPEETHEIARYLSRRSVPAEADLEPTTGGRKGAVEYATRCAACHGRAGEGRDDLRTPRLCGQHAAYLRRRIAESAAGLRGDADPAMAAIVRELPDVVVAQISDWLAASGCRAGEIR